MTERKVRRLLARVDPWTMPRYIEPEAMPAIDRREGSRAINRRAA